MPSRPPNTSLTTRALIVTLKSLVGGKTSAQIYEETSISIRQINRIYARAIERRFEPNFRLFTLKDEWLKDTPRSSRLLKQTPENIKNITNKVRTNRYGRKKTTPNLASKLSLEGIKILAIIVLQILKKAGFKKTKPTRKPRLTKKIREDSL